MSHFSVLVLVDTDHYALPDEGALTPDKVRDAVEDLLDPYDERHSVPPYEEECWCVTTRKRRKAKELAAERMGKDVDDLRDEFEAECEEKGLTEEQFDGDFGELHGKRQTLWESYLNPFLLEANEALEEVDAEPKPNCSSCEGTGTYTTRYNPDSKWDWFQIGGRWTGKYSEYEPAEDPDNKRACIHCGGTGHRDDEQVQGECNACEDGVETLWPTQWKGFPGDVLPARDVPEDEPTFAVVTPEGAWHEQGDMGWFGASDPKMSQEDWNEQFADLVREHQDALAVVVDCHI